MVFRKNSKRITASTACLLLLLGLPAVAENSILSLEAAVGKTVGPTVGDTISPPAESSRPDADAAHLLSHVAPSTPSAPVTPSASATKPQINSLPDSPKPTPYESGLEVAPQAEPILIAQASCATCGTALDPVLLMESGSKKKDKALLTDSLWGNLILEMAYQRDQPLHKLAKQMNILNLGTMASIGTIAGGTLSQGIIALQTLNPPDGHEDSYTPGIIGTTLSTATILTFVARMYFNHKMQKSVQDRQIAIRTRVETVLDHLERSESKCTDAQKDLTDLIGDRACHEWLQLWQSSHKLALSHPTRITLDATGVTAPAMSIAPTLSAAAACATLRDGVEGR